MNIFIAIAGIVLISAGFDIWMTSATVRYVKAHKNRALATFVLHQLVRTLSVVVLTVLFLPLV